SIAVQYDDGTQQVLDVDDKVILISEGRLADYDQLMDGDRVRLLLHITNKFTAVKEIVIEGSEHFITNVYKGLIYRIDETLGRLIVYNTEVLERGQWERTGQKGFAEIRLANGYSLYYEGKEISIEEINKYFRETEAYIAVEEDYGGEERAVVVSIRNKMDSEVLYDDSIYSAASGTGRFTLSKGHGYIRAETGSIIIKYGRLVSANSIMPQDMAYVVANRNFSSGEYVAGIVQITDRPGSGTFQIYRARIKSIEENKAFTVESFSRLDGLLWKYFNTEKTFRITYNTRILGEDGLINQRDFVGYGDESYVGSVVYIVADDTDAVVVSTAPYGIYNARGVIYSINMSQTGGDENIPEQPVGFRIRDAVIYDPYQHLWTNKNEMELNILKNSIILRGNTILEPSDIKKGDTVRVIKVDNSISGDAFIIIVEN
ncbi:MAG TPA: S-layer homology domain-containing protein, partial [Clostridiaceae bacterium]|nr:S-layer homology domain-containing protein [Clostridiaceae bacterium]